jgi:hypothetical protein
LASSSPSSLEPGPGEVPLPSSPVPSPTAIPSTHPAPVGPPARQISGRQEKKSTASPPALAPKPTTMSALLERAAKARGAATPSLRRDRGVATLRPTSSTSPASPPLKPSNRPDVVDKEGTAASHSASRVELPTGSRSEDGDRGELVSRFAAACQGGSLEHMASAPSDVLVSKGAAILAEVRPILSSFYPSFAICLSNLSN